MTETLANKVVIVAESGTCIGRAVKDVLLRHGCNVVLLSSTDTQKLEDTGSQETSLLQKNILALGTHQNDYTSIVDTSIQRFGSIHAVIFCSGELSRRNTESVTVEGVQDMWKNQVTGPCQLLIAAMPQLKINKGSVVFLSTSSSRAKDDILSNLAVIERDFLARLIAQEVSPFKISVNTVNSFGCEPRTESTWEWICSSFYGAPLIGRGHAQQVADHVALLLSTPMSHVTGCTMRIDGGVSITSPGSYSALMATLAYTNNVIMGWWNRVLKFFQLE